MWPRGAQRERLEIFVWNIRKNKPCIRSETKATVVSRLSEYYTALRAMLAKNADRFMDEAAAQTAGLMFGHDGDGAEPEPAR